MWQGCIRFILSFVLISLSAFKVAAAAPAFFVEGKDYTKYPATVRKNPDVEQLLLNDPNKVQVVFFFSYGCHACDALDPSFEKWVDTNKSNSKLVMYRYPVSFNAQWQMLAKMYYVMDYLDPKHGLNKKIFDGVHRQQLRLWQPAVMKTFFVQNGYSEKDFDQAFESFNLNRQVNRANELSKAYGIVETPEVVINGPRNSYLLNVVMAGNDVNRFYAILNYVAQRETKNLASGR